MSTFNRVVGTVAAAAFLVMFGHRPNASSPSIAPPNPLPAPWVSLDVGFPALDGSASATATGFIVEGAGNDIGGSADQFHFLYQALTGDGEVEARVDSLVQTNAWAKAGVMIRESLTAGSRHGSMFVSAARGISFLRRATTNGKTGASRGSRATAPYWIRVARRGQTVEGYESANGATWSLVGSQTLALPNTVYVGLAVTSRDAAALTTAVFSNVAVRQSVSNQPPAVAITSPASGVTMSAPATFTVSAVASDPDGSVASVDFYANSALVGSDTSSPYSATLSDLPTGTYSLTAVATDNLGATALSAVVSVTVSANQPPSVALTSPANGSTVVAPVYVSLAATAADLDGSVARVEFYVGSTLLGSDTTSPYSLNWNLLSIGNYTVSAVAVDNTGARSTPAVVNLSAVPSYAVFTAPSDHDTAVTSYLLEVFAAGADPETAAPLTMQDFGKPAPVNGDITVDITAALQPLGAGSYIATVSAMRSSEKSRSAPASFVR